VFARLQGQRMTQAELAHLTYEIRDREWRVLPFKGR
jgi:hypothetical protein